MTSLNIHVSPRGDDRNDGSAQHPLATLAAARDRLCVLRGKFAADARPAATVYLRAGTYALSESLRLGPEDSGRPGHAVVYRAWEDDEVRLSGGRVIDSAALVPVRDPAVRGRLDPAVAERVRQVDLRSVGLADAGVNRALGFAHPDGPGWLDLFCADRPLPVARWPREGYARTGAVLREGAKLGSPGEGRGDGLSHGAAFLAPDAPLRRWSNPASLRCFGMWHHEWAPATVPVAALDPQAGSITLAGPTAYGVGEGKEYRVLNVLDEIRAPGQWALDYQTSLLYLLPPENGDQARLVVSVLEAPLVVLDDAHHLVFRGLTFEHGRGDGITVQGEDDFIAGCTLRNLGGRGVRLHGRSNGVQSCHIHQTGQGGITLAGGDRRRLIPAGNFADNNEIHDVNRVCMTYNPSVHLYGVGQRVTHNLMYDGPHNAILLHGNDHLIEFNEFHHLAIETNDAAAIYMGRNPSEQGNLIRHNFFHHIGAYSPWGTSAVYVDDGACGTHLVGNVFYRCGYAGQVAMAAFFNNGGRDHLVEGNLFIDCPIAVGIMLSTLQDWQDFLRGTRKGMEYLHKWLYEDVDIRSETYLSRYPALRRITEDFGCNTIRRNLLVRCGKAVTPEERQTLEHNVMVAADPGFADEARMDFSLSAQAEAVRAIPGFTPPPLRQMGLYLDEHRRHLPARTLVDSRLDVLERPVVSRPGEEVTVKLALRVANLSTHPVSARLHLWSKPDGSVVAADTGPITLDLQPGQVVTRPLSMRMVARPDVQAVVGVRREGELFSLPVAVRPLYRVQVAALPAQAGRVHAKPGSAASPGAADLLASLTATLAGVQAMAFLAAGATQGALRLALSGDHLALLATLDDHAATSTTFPPASADNLWGGPMLGLLVAPYDARDTAVVRQVIFFPHGPTPPGTVWSYHGTEQSVPSDIVWQARLLPARGWELAALIPLHRLGLAAHTLRFRLEAMANLASSAEARRGLVTLFGSKTARLEVATLAEATVTR